MPADDAGHPDSSVRASDADRERVAAVIRDAAGAGLLTLDEADERLGAAYAARYVADLAPLTADLPSPTGGLTEQPSTVEPRRAVPGHGPAWWLPGRAALPAYLALSVLLIVIWAATGAGYFWPVWPILGVGVKMLGFRAWPSRTWAGRGCATRRS